MRTGSRHTDAREHRCSGSSKAPNHTYKNAVVKGPGGAFRVIKGPLANCPDNPEQHYHLPVHGGRVQPHNG